jgi:hypothetical protein
MFARGLQSRVARWHTTKIPDLEYFRGIGLENIEMEYLDGCKYSAIFLQKCSKTSQTYIKCVFRFLLRLGTHCSIYLMKNGLN